VSCNNFRDKHFNIKWVDRTHALGVFSNQEIGTFLYMFGYKYNVDFRYHTQLMYCQYSSSLVSDIDILPKLLMIV